MTHVAAPSPRGTNHERLYLTSQRPRMAHDADPRNQAFRAGQDRRRGGRRLGRDADPFSDALDQLQEHLQNAVTDPDDLSKANDLLEQLVNAMPDQSEDEASLDPEAQRLDPNLFLKGKLSAGDWKAYDEMCKARDARLGAEGGEDRRRRMAGDQRPQAGKLDKILATRNR
jgi:hypothetical protein